MHDNHRRLVFDIETVALPDAAQYVQLPDLEAVTAPSNWKDPEKIAVEIARKRAELMAEHETAVGKAALDWNCGRIVALGMLSHTDDVCVNVCRDETEEKVTLATFWAYWRRGHYSRLVGFFARSFDVPYLITRSRLLGVEHPDLSLARYGKGDVIDLREVLTFDDVRYDALMPRSLEMFCRRYGIEVEDAHSGKDVAALVAAGDYDAVANHCRADVLRTAALARRLGILQPVAEPVI